MEKPDLSFYARKQNALRVFAIVWASVRLSVRPSVRLSHCQMGAIPWHPGEWNALIHPIVYQAGFALKWTRWNWGNHLTFTPSSLIQSRGSKFCQNTSGALWNKNFQHPSSPNRKYMRGQRKISHHAPSKSLRCICPEFCPCPALDVPYKGPKVDARRDHSFSARQKKWIERMPSRSMQDFLKLRVSLTLLSQHK